MAVLDDLADSAARFDKWKQVQDVVKTSDAERDMAAKRAAFDSNADLIDADALFLEQTLEDDNLMPIRYFELGRLASKPVARIRVDAGPRLGEGYATGFLIAPGLLMTNWHVLPNVDRAHIATLSFDAEDDVRGYPLTPCVFSLRPEVHYVSDAKLDYCIVAVAPTSIDQKRSIEEFGFLRLVEKTGKILREEYATIIQHPRGRQKHVAARNNRVIVYVYDGESAAPDNDFIYYQSDTQKGSSGSPVLSDQFFVVALHRRGVPATRLIDGKRAVLRRDGTLAQKGDPAEMIRYVANEGVRISRILKSLKRKAASNPAVDDILTQIKNAAEGGRSGPFWVSVAAPNRISTPTELYSDELEIVRRKASAFDNPGGYDADFLGIHLPLPDYSGIEHELAPRIDGQAAPLLHFRHFTTAVHARRRMPVFAAVNIDGAAVLAVNEKQNRPGWSYDPRIAEEHQLDDSIHSSLLQRGHMAAREFIYWGDDASVADRHSFTLTNVCPQIRAFNGSLEWYQLERNIIAFAKAGPKKLSLFMGPVLNARDPLYDSLRSDQSKAVLDSGIRLPRKFWYIVAWNENGALKHRTYLLDQADDLKDAGPLEVDLVTPQLVKEITLSKAAQLSRLRFPGLA